MPRENRMAAEVYEPGNANMEFDAALDAMTIDAGHENALGMEGADMYQNQLAKLSGSLDQMSTAGGIDFDGDGVVDVSASKPGAMMKYTEEGAFKVQFIPTGKTMGPGGDPACELVEVGRRARSTLKIAGARARVATAVGAAAALGADGRVHPEFGRSAFFFCHNIGFNISPALSFES